MKNPKKLVLFLFISSLSPLLFAAPRTYSVQVKDPKWSSNVPAKVCKQLVESLQFNIDMNSKPQSLTFIFQGLTYTAPLAPLPSKGMHFAYAADSESESTFINIDGKLSGKKFEGRASIQIEKKDIGIATSNKANSWKEHKYDCSVSYDFTATSQ